MHGDGLPPVVLLSMMLCGTSLPLQDHQAVTAKLGKNVSLGCLGPSEAEVTLFTWTKVGLDSDYMFFYYNGQSSESHQHEAFRGRVDLRDSSSMKDGDFSVILQNVSMRDEGTYECRIITRNPGGYGGFFQHSINLMVSGTDEEPPKEREDEEMKSDEFLLAAFGITLTVLLLIYIIVCCALIVKAAVFSKYKSVKSLGLADQLRKW